MLKKVISGGQTGVDFAALKAAKHCGFKTGGWIPQGLKTLNGPNTRLGKDYGLKETLSYNYAERTDLNVRDSDGTIRIAGKWDTPGEKCTKNAIMRWQRASVDISVHDLHFKEAAKCVLWIKNSMIQTLNVAGNAEQTHPGIEELAYQFLMSVFGGLQKLRSK